jgi:hypothetical protein
MTRASLANLEAGRQRMNAYTLVVLAQYLDCPLEDLVPDVRPEVSGADGIGRQRMLERLPEGHRSLVSELLASAVHGGEIDAATEAKHRRS